MGIHKESSINLWVNLKFFANTHKDKWLSEDVRASLEKYHKMFRSGKEVEAVVLREYEVLVEGVLEKLLSS